MNHAAFQLNKFRRLIKTSGRQFEFTVKGKNEFGECDGNPTPHKVQGIFHESPKRPSGYVVMLAADASTTRAKNEHMIMALWEDTLKITRDSMLQFNGKTYKVVDVTNIYQANLIADISLEEVHN